VAIKHEDIKNLVMQELLNESINNEGVADWLKKQSSKFLSGAGKTLSGAGEKLKPGDPNFVKKLDKIGDFLQDAQRDKDITAAIMQTELGKKVFSSQEKSLEEALGGDFAKMMKDKKVTPQEVSSFISAMSKNKKAKQMLDGLGIEIEVGDQDVAGSSPADSAPQTPAGSATTAPTNGATPPPLPADAGGADDVIAVFKGKTKGPKGTSDSLHTQLTRQFKNIPDSGKLITAISKDLLNQLKVNGLKVQESAEQVEQFLLKELIENKLEHQSLSYLLKENNSLDYRLTSQILESLQEGEREKKRKEEHVRQLGFVFDNGEVNWKAFAAAVKDAKQKGEAKDDDEFIMKGLEKRKGEGEKDLGGAAAVQNAKDAEQNNTAAARQLAADTNPNSTPDAQRTQDSVIPQPAPDAPASVSSEKPKDLGNIQGGETPDVSYASQGFDDNQKKQIVRTLASQGFKQEQVSKVINAFSDWLKNRPKQQAALKEASGSSKVKELLSQFMKETNFAIDGKLMNALADTTIKTMGNPDKPQGPVRANTSATAGKMPDISQAAKTMGAGVAQKEPAQAQPTSGPKQSGQMVGRQQQISKAADAAFKMTTPAKAGFVNVGEVVGRKLKAMAQLNAKSGAAIVPLIPKILKAIEGFLNYALSKSGKKNVKILGGIKNAAALQKTVQQASQGSKAAIPAGVDIMKTQQKQKAALKEALAQEIFNLLIGKTK